MKKFAGLLCALGLLVLTVSGCASMTRASQYSAPLKIQVAADLKTDIEVGERISGTATKRVLLGICPITLPDKFATGVDYYYGANRDLAFVPALGSFVDPYWNVKAAAAYDAISKSGADVLVAPRYEIEVTWYGLFTTTTATVTGFKGKIKSIK